LAKIPDVQTSTLACSHLGLSDDPLVHEEQPSTEHRCYLWMQRDMIDRSHQENFCLSGNHDACPWIQVSSPGRSSAKNGKRQQVTGYSPGGPLRTVLFTTARLVMAGARRAAVLLRLLAAWIWANVRRAAPILWKALVSVAGAVARRITRAGKDSGKRLPQLHVKQRSPQTNDQMQGADFEMLMRLGRKANRSGRRKEAYLCFSRAVALDESSEEGWLWMAATAETPADAQLCLERALTLNPASEKGRTALASLARSVAPVVQEVDDTPNDGLSASMLVDAGIKAMNQHNEDSAHHFFAAATEADRSNETAWSWRARTATDLAEAITCLEQVLEINPDNTKAQASLKSAMERQRMEKERQSLAYAMPQQTPFGASYLKPDPPQPPALLQVASMGYMLLGLLWSAPLVLLLLDDSLAALYHRIGLLPLLDIPYQSSAVLGLQDIVPEFNLYLLVPGALAVLCFIAMETLSSARRIAYFYVALVSGTSIYATVRFIADQPAASWGLLAVGYTSAMIALTGQFIYRRRLRRQRNGEANKKTAHAGLAVARQSKAAQV